MYTYYGPRYYNYPNRGPYVRNNQKDDGRGLLLPLLFGAAVGFPIGYIASNTNKNQGYGYPAYPQPYMAPYPMQYPMTPMPMY